MLKKVDDNSKEVIGGAIKESFRNLPSHFPFRYFLETLEKHDLEIYEKHKDAINSIMQNLMELRLEIQTTIDDKYPEKIPEFPKVVSSRNLVADPDELCCPNCGKYLDLTWDNDQIVDGELEISVKCSNCGCGVLNRYKVEPEFLSQEEIPQDMFDWYGLDDEDEEFDDADEEYDEDDADDDF